MTMKIYGPFKKRLGHYDKYGKWARKKILTSGTMCAFCSFSLPFMLFPTTLMTFDPSELEILFLGFTRFLVLNLPLCHLCTKHPSNRLPGLEALSSLFSGSQIVVVDSVLIMQTATISESDIQFRNVPFEGTCILFG